MCFDIDEFKRVLEEFSKLPKIDRSSTMLEICQYPGSRFEEVCSRILKFFFNPNAEHQLYYLWLGSLWELIEEKTGKTCEEKYDYNSIKINTEERACDKRIDLTIVTRSFVIAIENKITAVLNNPLEEYKKYVESEYKEQKHYFLVLSVNPVGDSVLEKGFLRCRYIDLFEIVERRLGYYVMKANKEYLFFMFDFMKYINTMNGFESKQEKEFFLKNADIVEGLINRYNEFKDVIYKEQCDASANILEKIKEKTKDNSWWIYQKTDIGIKFNEDLCCIGIESWFARDKTGACGRFKIKITTWNLESWKPYRDEVLSWFSSLKEPAPDEYNRINLWVADVSGDEDNVIKELRKIYEVMKGIAAKVRQKIQSGQ